METTAYKRAPLSLAVEAIEPERPSPRKNFSCILPASPERDPQVGQSVFIGRALQPIQVSLHFL
jgi:hypothetical protein